MDTHLTACTKPSENIKLRYFIVLVNKDLEKFDQPVSLARSCLPALTIKLIIKILTLCILNLRDLFGAHKQIIQRIFRLTIIALNSSSQKNDLALIFKSNIPDRSKQDHDSYFHHIYKNLTTPSTMFLYKYKNKFVQKTKKKLMHYSLYTLIYIISCKCMQRIFFGQIFNTLEISLMFFSGILIANSYFWFYR